MILINSDDLDPHADHVGEMLRRRGADFVRFNPARFPSGASISLWYTPAGQPRAVLDAGGVIDLDQLTAVWHRRPRPPVPHHEVVDDAARRYIEEECCAHVNDVWHSLGCLSVPAPPSVVRRAELKASQLRVAGELGFELPPTLFTNSPEEFLEFYRLHDGNVVSKLAGASFYKAMGATFSRYTQVVSRRDVARAHAVRYCPVIFQAYVPKRLELRVTVVGRRAFAAEIHSQVSNHTRHDWRRYDLQRTPHFPHDLPPEEERRCVRLVERLGLCYGAIDMVVTPEGRYVFLEINPNGQYLWIEELTGLPISEAICDLLTAGSVPG
jgi:glutathione synthase/RimK-type ligase-like ATP-grasp enzyme